VKTYYVLKNIKKYIKVKLVVKTLRIK